MNPVYISPVMSHLPHLVLEEQPTDVCNQCCSTDYRGAEEGSCEDTGVVSLTFDYYYELNIY